MADDVNRNYPTAGPPDLRAAGFRPPTTGPRGIRALPAAPRLREDRVGSASAAANLVFAAPELTG